MESAERSNKILIVLSLFILGGTFHYLIYEFVQTDAFVPSDFRSIISDNRLFLMSVLISFQIFGAVSNQLLVGKFGLKNVLIFGFFLDLVALFMLSLVHISKGPYEVIFTLIVIKTAIIGAALTMILVSVISYIVFEMPKRIGSGIIAFFAFANVGAFLIFPIFLDICISNNLERPFLFIAIALTVISIWVIYMLLINPRVPSELVHLRKGSRIWKELHYRLFLFLVAVLLFSLCASAYTTWGRVHLDQLFEIKVANEIIVLFWIFVIISQFFLSFFLAFLDFRKIFYFLVTLILLSQFLIIFDMGLKILVFAFAVGGMGCSGAFAIIVSGMERELIEVTKRYHNMAFLPYVEFTIAWMVATFLIGEGVGNFVVNSLKGITLASTFYYFQISAVFAFLMLIFISYLFYTAPYRSR